MVAPHERRWYEYASANAPLAREVLADITRVKPLYRKHLRHARALAFINIAMAAWVLATVQLNWVSWAGVTLNVIAVALVLWRPEQNWQRINRTEQNARRLLADVEAFERRLAAEETTCTSSGSTPA